MDLKEISNLKNRVGQMFFTTINFNKKRSNNDKKNCGLREWIKEKSDFFFNKKGFYFQNSPTTGAFTKFEARKL